jgi:hypothetical protein
MSNPQEPENPTISIQLNKTRNMLTFGIRAFQFMNLEL